MAKKKPEAIIKELKKLQPNCEWLPIGDVYENPENPRIISEQALEDLKASITGFPEMMVLRPGVIDSAGMLHGNNQRHKACVLLGWKEFPIIRANGLSEEQLKEFMIRDNLPAGTWDTDTLFKDWDLEDLKSWDFNMELLDVRVKDFQDITTKKPPAETVKHQKTLHLKYTEAQFTEVKELLGKIAETPEEAIWQLLHPATKK